MVTIQKTYQFSAAHRLPALPKDHKCHALHGHTYAVLIEVAGTVNPVTGFVMDFAELSKRWRPIHSKLDHSYLNEIEGLQTPTSEVIAKWIYDKMAPTMPEGTCIRRITVSETPSSCAVYTHEG